MDTSEDTIRNSKDNEIIIKNHFKTKADFDMALVAVWRVHDLAQKGKINSSCTGICYNLNEYGFPFNSAIAFCAFVSLKWPGREKDCTIYPITENHGIGKWEGTNLEQRLSLLKYMAKRLRDMKRRAKE